MKSASRRRRRARIWLHLRPLPSWRTCNAEPANRQVGGAILNLTHLYKCGASKHSRTSAEKAAVSCHLIKSAYVLIVLSLMVVHALVIVEAAPNPLSFVSKIASVASTSQPPPSKNSAVPQQLVKSARLASYSLSCPSEASIHPCTCIYHTPGTQIESEEEEIYELSPAITTPISEPLIMTSTTAPALQSSSSMSSTTTPSTQASTTTTTTQPLTTTTTTTAKTTSAPKISTPEDITNAPPVTTTQTSEVVQSTSEISDASRGVMVPAEKHFTATTAAPVAFDASRPASATEPMISDTDTSASSRAPSVPILDGQTPSSSEDTLIKSTPPANDTKQPAEFISRIDTNLIELTSGGSAITGTSASSTSSPVSLVGTTPLASSTTAPISLVASSNQTEFMPAANHTNKQEQSQTIAMNTHDGTTTPSVAGRTLKPALIDSNDVNANTIVEPNRSNEDNGTEPAGRAHELAEPLVMTTTSAATTASTSPPKLAPPAGNEAGANGTKCADGPPVDLTGPATPTSSADSLATSKSTPMPLETDGMEMPFSATPTNTTTTTAAPQTSTAIQTSETTSTEMPNNMSTTTTTPPTTSSETSPSTTTLEPTTEFSSTMTTTTSTSTSTTPTLATPTTTTTTAKPPTTTTTTTTTPSPSTSSSSTTTFAPSRTTATTTTVTPSSMKPAAVSTVPVADHGANSTPGRPQATATALSRASGGSNSTQLAVGGSRAHSERPSSAGRAIQPRPSAAANITNADLHYPPPARLSNATTIHHGHGHPNSTRHHHHSHQSLAAGAAPSGGRQILTPNTHKPNRPAHLSPSGASRNHSAPVSPSPPHGRATRSAPARATHRVLKANSLASPGAPTPTPGAEADHSQRLPGGRRLTRFLAPHSNQDDGEPRVEVVAYCRNIQNPHVLRAAIKGFRGHQVNYFVIDSCKMPPFPNDLFHGIDVRWLEMTNTTVQFHDNFLHGHNHEH